MSDSTLWWILAGLAVSAELLTGTFHLVMLALGLAAGALAAHAGLDITWQLVCAAVIGSGAVAVLQAVRPKPPQSQPAESNADVNLDIGQTLHIDHWDAGHLTQAPYRGALWSVEWLGGSSGDRPAPGLYRIQEVVGSRLRVTKA